MTTDDFILVRLCVLCVKKQKKKNIVIIKSNSIKHQDRQNWLTGGPSRGVERQHSLQSHKCERDAEGLEHQLHHPLPVLHRVHGGFGQQHRVILGTHRQLLERVMPDLQQRETNTKKTAGSESKMNVLPQTSTHVKVCCECISTSQWIFWMNGKESCTETK